jgi:hypothetical protein
LNVHVWNTQSDGENDSRREHSELEFDKAVKLWNQADTNFNNAKDAFSLTNPSSYGPLIGTGLQREVDQTRALFYLGQSLHPYQDIDAHGTIRTTEEHSSGHDSRKFVWRDETRTTVKFSFFDRQRANDSGTRTGNRLNIFRTNTGLN